MCSQIFVFRDLKYEENIKIVRFVKEKKFLAETNQNLIGFNDFSHLHLAFYYVGWTVK